MPKLIRAGGGSVPVVTGSTVTALNAAFAGSPPDGAIGIIRVGTYPDLAQVELTYISSQSKWVQMRHEQLIHMLDQGYMGLSNAGSAGTTDNSVYGLVYVAAGSFNVGNAGNTNQVGYSIAAIEQAALLYTAGLKIQGRMQGFFAGTGTVAMTTIPHWFQRDSGDVPASFADAGPRLGIPADAINSANVTSNARLAIVSPTALIAGGVQWLTTGWTDIPELTNVNVTKKYLYPRLFAKMPSAIASPNPCGAMIDVQVAARWTS